MGRVKKEDGRGPFLTCFEGKSFPGDAAAAALAAIWARSAAVDRLRGREAVDLQKGTFSTCFLFFNANREKNHKPGR